MTALILAAILAIQTPQVQTFVTKSLLSGISEKLDGNISFDKIHLKPFNTLMLRHVAITDKAPLTPRGDTLFHAEYIIARFSLSGLVSGNGIRINKVYISNACMNLVSEEDGVNLERIFRLGNSKEKPESNKTVFNIRKATLDGIRFRLINPLHDTTKFAEGGINWDDLDVQSIVIHAKDIDLTGKIMSGSISHMSFKEKSGYECRSISGSAKVGHGKAIVEDFHLSDLWSEIFLPSYIMSYASGEAFSDYINAVKMDGVIRNSYVDMKSISFFAPELSHVTMKARLDGTVSGPVKDLSFKNIDFTTDAGVSGLFDGRLTGLPEISESKVEVAFKDFNISTAGIEETVKAWVPETDIKISDIAKGATMKLTGKAQGAFNDLDLDLRLGLDSGYVLTDISMKNMISKNQPIVFEGSVLSRNFDLGRIIGTDFIRQCSMRASLMASLGTQDEGPKIRLDSLKVYRLNMNDYDYTNIAAAGTMEKARFDGKVICNDPNLNFMFQGIFSLSSMTSNALYKFYANIGYADLNALNFDKRGISKIRFQTLANFKKINSEDVLGKIEVSDVVLENDLGKHDIGTVTVSSYSGDNLYKLNLNSSFADAAFTGNQPVGRFVKDLVDLTLRKEVPALFRKGERNLSKNRYDLSFRSHNSINLLAFALPGLYISDSTDIDVKIDTSGNFSARMTSPRIAFKENFMKNIVFSLNNMDSTLGGELTGETLNVATLKLEKNSIKLYANDNFVGLGYTYDNRGELINRGELFLTSALSRDDNNELELHIEALPSRLFLNSREWSINPSSIDIYGKDIKVNEFEVSSDDQNIKLYGGLSGNRSDTLQLRLERFDISVINSLIGNKFGISGALTGDANVISPSKDAGLEFNFVCDSTRIADTPMGTLKIASRWNEGFRRFDIALNNTLDSGRTFDIIGNYTPSMKRIEVAADLNRFDIGYIRPFTEGIFSDMSGKLSGKLFAEGPVSSLKLYSRDAHIDDAMLKIAFTNVPYNLSGGFHIDDTGIHFDNISVRDRHGNTGAVHGGIYFSDFSNMKFDTRINVSEMEAINLRQEDNDIFYGNIFASGNVSITGPINALMLNVDAKTTNTGSLHIPIPSSANAVSGNLLTFKEAETEAYVDPYEEMIKKIKKRDKVTSQFGVKARVAATPGVEAFIEIDKATGNVLSGRGSGIVDLEISNDVFNIFGDYTLTSGSYRFAAQGIAYRDFSIKDGSSIKFNGDIMESLLNIDATYRTKTSLATLIADTSSVSTRRTVDCGIKISEKIKNPRLNFSINIPDIDPAVKSRVESALSTEDKVQKQFLSLIVFNSFLPDEQSGIVNNASMLYSTVSEIMYNQLNNIFQRLDIPIDLGLNYQPTDRGNDLFDVAVSTQLFNNRVIVNGNIGNRQYNSGGNGGNVVGDLDIEIKLDRPGLFRLNLFSHSADQYSNYLDNSQRNGIGFTYQQEFNTFKEFFHNMFTSKKKKKRESESLKGKEMVQEKKTIIIEADNGRK